jgi:hypothetical protein
MSGMITGGEKTATWFGFGPRTQRLPSFGPPERSKAIVSIGEPVCSVAKIGPTW